MWISVTATLMTHVLHKIIAFKQGINDNQGCPTIELSGLYTWRHKFNHFGIDPDLILILDEPSEA